MWARRIMKSNEQLYIPLIRSIDTCTESFIYSQRNAVSWTRIGITRTDISNHRRATRRSRTIVVATNVTKVAITYADGGKRPTGISIIFDANYSNGKHYAGGGNGGSCACRKLGCARLGAESTKIEARRVVKREREQKEERDLWTRSAENWCIPYAKQQKHGASSSWTTRNRESSTVSLHGILSPRLSFSPLVRLAFYHHQRLRHLRPEQNRERYRSN